MAQAVADGFMLITQDRKLAAYEPLVNIVWNEVP